MTPSVMQLEEKEDKRVEVTYLIPDLKILEILCEKGQSYEVVSITGFEIYIVEQWATERKYSTVITAFTGDSDHEIKAGKITLPSDTSKRSDKMNHFFKEVEIHGKRKITEEGVLFITNLAKFPSNLNLLPVVGGSILEVWDSFKVNLNLRKLNCGGRSALLLCSPSDVSEDKFRQIYKTHPKVDIIYSVEELVKLIQICLVDFKLLDPSFVDGLFCNQTEESISQWWSIYGQRYFGISNPKDGKLGPTTVSAILGFVLSCTFRLHIAGCDIPKEPFNYFSFRVNAGKFQKQYNLIRTWYLDPETVEKLFKVTNKKAVDISTLKKVVNYTVHDLPGRTSTIQLAQEVLTTDLEKAIKYFNCSARLQYLWNGKGNVNDIKRFDYTVKTSHEQNTTSTFRSGVGKIKNLPKKLQDEPSARKKDKIFLAELSSPNQTDHELTDDETTTGDEYVSSPAVNRTLSLDENSIEEKVEIKTERNFDCCQVLKQTNRRLSYPYLVSDLGVNQLPYENHSIKLFRPIEKEILLKRNKSFSFVEDSILKFDIELPEPIYLSNKFFKIDKKLQLMGNLNHTKRFEPYRIKINQKYENVKRLKHQITPVFHRFELQKQEDERITTKIEDIKAIGARLEYEIRILQNKIRDTEDCVNSFVDKVQALETSINQELLSCSDQKNDQLWVQPLFAKGGVVRNLIEKMETMSFFKWLQTYHSIKNEKQE